MKLPIGYLVALSLLVVGACPAAAEDPSIDRLLHKLPPPEKIVRPGLEADPALADPIAKEMIDAAKARRIERALILSRRLVQRHPKSSGANFIHGLLALSLQRFGEAEAAYRGAIANQPKFTIAYVGLGASEAAQHHYAEALSTFQKVTRMEPKAEIGWIAASGCAGKLGRRQESVAYARSATEIAPNSFAAWSQLATAQRAIGDNREAAKSQGRANKLRRPTRSLWHW
jgi:tetratricopeptide (TPR) repeat protein